MIENIVKDTIKEFCHEFLQSPYICYTEHGLHAFFTIGFILKFQKTKDIFS